MRRLALFTMGMVLAGLSATAFAADPWMVGEKWTYQHEGDVPFRPPGTKIVGDRTREVIAVQGESEKKRWIIQEKWGDNDEQPAKHHVDAKRMNDKIEMGENAALIIDPPFPFDYMDLKAGEEKKYEPKFQWNENPPMTIKITAKRVEDESIKAPAGEFKDCAHVISEETFGFTGQDGQAVAITTMREFWLHPSVNGFVKWSFSTQVPGRPEASTGTGLLKAYSKEKK
ncbi:MAG: hypothetical protein AB1656_20830 [Candidatus Omnitrophota bacterium]